jgi:hypothetical protein
VRPDSGVRFALAHFVLALGAYAYLYGGWGANQEVNYALTRAIVEAHTLTVDRFTPHEGDIANGLGGHLYINKAPGLSMLGAIPYSIQFALEERHIIVLADYWRTNKELVTIAVCGITGALIGACLYLYGRRTLGASHRAASIVAIAISFGTIVFPYSTMMFAHVPSAFFLLLALILVEDHPLMAGAAAGLSAACFYLSAFPACILIALAWHFSRTHAARFAAGAAPFAIGMAVYQWTCFGSPFTTAVERSINFTEKDRLLGVFGAPRLVPLWAVTFSEYRGLFYCSPVLLFAIAGTVVMIRRRLFLPQLCTVLAMVAVMLAAVVSFNGWHGGAAFGPRYLLGAIPLLGIPMMFVADRARWLWIPAMIVSTAINLAATVVDPMPIDGMTHPLTRYIAPSLMQRRIFLAQDAGDLGEALFGKGSLPSVVPVIVWIVLGAILILYARNDVSRNFSSTADAAS